MATSAPSGMRAAGSTSRTRSTAERRPPLGSNRHSQPGALVAALSQARVAHARVVDALADRRLAALVRPGALAGELHLDVLHRAAGRALGLECKAGALAGLGAAGLHR